MALFDRRFNGKNSIISSRELHNSRNKYDLVAYEDLNSEFSDHGLQRTSGDYRTMPKPVMDFHLIHKAYYGKIDYMGHPIVLRNKVDKSGSRVSTKKMKDLEWYIKFATPYKTLAVIRNNDKPIQVVNFVSYAFGNFIKDYQYACNCEQVISKNKYLSKIKAYKGYESVYVLHKKHKKLIYDNFITYINVTMKKNYIGNFENFIFLFLQYIEHLGDRWPITRTAFVKSRLANPFISGLTIAIADLNCGNDQSKINKFIDDPGFELYMKKAIKHGFMIDKHIPWRLVANLASSPMQEYMKSFGTANLEVFFDINYNHAYKDDFKVLKKYMIAAYNSFIRANKKYSKKPTFFNNRMKANTKRRRPITKDELDENYSESYWLKLYAKIRNIEESNFFDEASLEGMTQEIDILSKVKDSGYIERYIDNKFGQIDSMSDYTTRRTNTAKSAQHLEEDKLPARKIITEKELRDFLTGVEAVPRHSPDRAKQLAAIAAKKYGGTMKPKHVNPDGKLSLKGLAQAYYKRTDDLGGNFLEESEFYFGPGDLGPGTNAENLVAGDTAERREGSLLYDRQSNHIKRMYVQRDNYESADTDADAETDQATLKTPSASRTRLGTPGSDY